MGDCSFQPLANSKGVVGDCESEGSYRQSSDPRNTACPARRETLSGISGWMSLQTKTKSQNYTENRSVNDAGTWDEGYSSYHGRSHRRAETQYEARMKKICCEKSAEAIVAVDTSHE